jgi:predicted secreted protein/photosystem II stability/assembly factor-like uncharacterized protein
MAQRGRKILIKKEIEGVYVTIAGMVSRTITVSNDNTDITTDTTGEVWRQLLGNTNTFIDVSGDAVFKDDIAMKQLEQDASEGAADNYRLCFENGDSITGIFLPISFEYTGETLNAQKASFTLGSTGQLDLYRFYIYDYTGVWGFADITYRVPGSTYTGPAMDYDSSTGTWLMKVDSRKIYRSTDDGVTWAQVYTAPFSVGAIGSLSSDNNGTWIFIGNTTHCYRSTDAGATWTLTIFATTSTSYREVVDYGNGVWIVAGGEEVQRSTDGGLNWTRVLDSSVSPRKITNDGAGNWLGSLHNSPGLASFTSQDDGLTWQSHSLIYRFGPGYLACGYYNGVWLLVGANRTILRSIDPFNNVWTIAQLASGPADFRSVEYFDDVGFVAGAENNEYQVSVDLGLTWGAVALVPNRPNPQTGTVYVHVGGTFYFATISDGVEGGLYGVENLGLCYGA